MSLKKCLDEKVLAGRLTRAQADDILNRVKEYEEAFKRSLGPVAARAEALARVAKEALENAERAQVNKVRQILAQTQALENARSHKKGFAAGATAVLVRDRFGAAGYGSVEARQMAVRKTLEGIWADGIEAYRRTAAGLRSDVAGMRNLVYEAYGRATGDNAAAASARSYAKAADLGVALAQEAGARIGRKENWLIPQRFSPGVVAKLGRERFVALMQDARAKGWLAIDDWKKPGLEVSEERAAEIIENAYARIVSNGDSDIVPGQSDYVALADSMRERRAFRWTSPEAWLWANRTFGLGDAHIFDLFVSHLDGMARDIGLLQTLGPDPDATIRVLADTARKEGDRTGAYFIQSAYNQVSGSGNAPNNHRAAAFMREARALFAAADLGSALLSAPGDFATLALSARWVGLPVWKVFSEYARLFSPASKADRAQAARAGFIFDSYTQRVSSVVRDQMDQFGSGLFTQVADTVLKLSLLTHHTDVARAAFARVAMGQFADLSGRTFERLPKETLRFFEAHGIGKGDWELMKAHGVVDYGNGIRFMEPLAMVNSGNKAAREAGLKFQGALLEEIHVAVPTAGALERAVVLQQTRPGTVAGEFLRSFGQYKGFPLSVLLSHGYRAVQELSQGRASYLASLAVGLTAMGALSVQLKAIAQGKDPREMWGDPAISAKFWGAAFVQGGGAGIIGDFLYAGLSRSGQNPASTFFLGPAGSRLDSFVDITLGNIAQTAEDKDTNIGVEAIKAAKKLTPGSSLWYARLAMDRLLWDALQKQIDPDYSRHFARLENRIQKEYGQRFWSPPGSGFPPSRGPDFGAMVR